MRKSLLASFAGLCLASASAASAQVIYEPVTYQYPVGDTYLYYGGRDARGVVERAAARYRLYDHPRSYDADGRERATVRAGLTTRAPLVYTDAAPYVNASLYGFTDVDARNEAYANVPTYFRKRDLLADGVVQPDGSVVVPATAGGTSAAAVTRRRPLVVAPATRPVPKAIIIIPKRPSAPANGARPASDKSVTRAE